MWLNAIFTKVKLQRAGQGWKHGLAVIDWKLSDAQMLHLTSNLNCKHSADLL